MSNLRGRNQRKRKDPFTRKELLAVLQEQIGTQFHSYTWKQRFTDPREERRHKALIFIKGLIDSLYRNFGDL